MQSDTDYVRFLLRWHGIPGRRRGLPGLRRSIDQLQGVSLPFSELERPVLSARVGEDAGPLIDELVKSGEVVWQGNRRAGEHDGWISLFFESDFALLGSIRMFAPGAREQLLRDALLETGGMTFDDLSARLGGFPDDLMKTLWKLVWNGEVSNDTLNALRAVRSSMGRRYHHRPRPRYRTRKIVPSGSAGHWRLLSGPGTGFAPEPERQRALAIRLLDRFGMVCPSAASRDGVDLSDLAASLGRLEEEGRACRDRLSGSADTSCFVAPGAGDIWRDARNDPGTAVLSACDPANPIGAVMPWPRMVRGYSPSRAPGARVYFHQGRLAGYLGRTGRDIHMPEDAGDPGPLIELLTQSTTSPVYLESINGDPPFETAWHSRLVEAGFSASRGGYLLPKRR